MERKIDLAGNTQLAQTAQIECASTVPNARHSASPAWLLGLTLALGLAALGLSGCRVHVDKDGAGEDKHVQVDTPFGGVHVNTNQTTATDLGLPAYPGAQTVTDDDQHKSADVHLGFGQWELRVREVSYGTPDSRDKVTAFYKKALSRFGDVITCNGSKPVGLPATTHEGLNCEDDQKSDNSSVTLDNSDFNQDFQLKAGSKHHQHIMGFQDSKGGQTKFALVQIDLPSSGVGSDDSSGDKKE